MSIDPSRSDLTIGIVGVGAMGRGIAQIAALSGIKVLLYDMNPDAVEGARGFVEKMILRLQEKEKINVDQAKKSIDLLVPVPDLKSFSVCHVVIELSLKNSRSSRSFLRNSKISSPMIASWPPTPPRCP